MLSPCPKGWTRHASAFDIALCLSLAQDSLITDCRYDVVDWLITLLDAEGVLLELPASLSVLSVLVEEAMKTPAAGDILLVFGLGARAAYRQVAAEEWAGLAAAESVLWDWSIELMEEC